MKLFQGLTYFDTAWFTIRIVRPVYRKVLKKSPSNLFFSPQKAVGWWNAEDAKESFSNSWNAVTSDYFDFTCTLEQRRIRRIQKAWRLLFWRRMKAEAKSDISGFLFTTSRCLSGNHRGSVLGFRADPLNYLDWKFQNALRQNEINERKGIPASRWNIRGDAWQTWRRSQRLSSSIRSFASVALGRSGMRFQPNVMVVSTECPVSKDRRQSSDLTEFLPITKKIRK